MCASKSDGVWRTSLSAHREVFFEFLSQQFHMTRPERCSENRARVRGLTHANLTRESLLYDVSHEFHSGIYGEFRSTDFFRFSSFLSIICLHGLAYYEEGARSQRCETYFMIHTIVKKLFNIRCPRISMVLTFWTPCRFTQIASLAESAFNTIFEQRPFRGACDEFVLNLALFGSLCTGTGIIANQVARPESWSDL